MTDDAKEVGEVKRMPPIQQIEWRISDFFTVAEDKIICLASSMFPAAGVLWYLRLWPNVSHLYLACDAYRLNKDVTLASDAHRKYTLEYDCGLKKYDGTVEHFVNGIVKKNEARNVDNYEFIKREQLLERKSELVPSNVLTIVCTMKCVPEVSQSSSQPETVLNNATALKLIKLDTLSKNFKDLKAHKESCDTTLQVQDKEYKAHRAILIARSPVFAAMFLHETSEKQTGIVTISDCDPDSFEDFLEFLYSGKFEDPTSHGALYLYETSDKYEVQELKTFCVEYLTENLSLENVCDVAILADKYEEANLLSAAQDFFNKNLGEIFDTSGWDSLVKNNYRLSKILLKRMSSKVKVVD